MSSAADVSLPLSLAWRSDRGLVRKRNEDAVAVDDERRLVAIADGVGGAAGGDVASALAVKAAVGWLAQATAAPANGSEPEGLVERAVHWANQDVCRVGRETSWLRGMATTLVVGMFLPDRLVYAHVGDSRLYRCRSGRLEPLTRDHSLLQEAVDRGRFRTLEEARRAGIPGNIITRVVGAPDLLGPNIASTRLAPGDLYLFCTDGLTKLVDDEDLEDLLSTARSLEVLADDLVAVACERGGDDNVSVVLARIGEGAQGAEARVTPPA